MLTDMDYPLHKQLELVSFLKTNGDTCMFSYDPLSHKYILGTSTHSVLCSKASDVKDKALSKIA
jgi:hypothetical protein